MQQVHCGLFYLVLSMNIEHNDDEGKKKVNYSHQGADGNARMCDKSPAGWNLCVPINQG